MMSSAHPAAMMKLKEYAMFDLHENQQKNIVPFFLLKDRGFLELFSTQMFTANYINPNTEYNRLLLKWETGAGKTIGALSVAMNFINFYKKEEITGIKIGTVFVIGFTQSIFKATLLQFPEFGFITPDEQVQLNKLEKIAEETGRKGDVENYARFKAHIRRRLTNRRGNGFFEFWGYKELANRVFLSKSVDIHALTDVELAEHIQSGQVTINEELIKMFTNSLLLIDEVHNIYNSNEKNIWGIAIQQILNRNKTCRAVFLSATPLNNSPTEIIDLLNLLLPRDRYPELKKQEFFDGIELKPGAADRFKELFAGRISFIRDLNPQYFPSKAIRGERIPGVDLLKFYRCPMSKFHVGTYEAYLKEDGRQKLYINDFALPNPAEDDPWKPGTGIASFSEVKENLSVNNKLQIMYDPISNMIKGRGILANLEKISGKYFRMTQLVLELIKNHMGKILIYHNLIHMSGTLFIKEILSYLGMISESDVTYEDTLCFHCLRRMKEHSSPSSHSSHSSGKDQHAFAPVRYSIVHNELPQKLTQAILARYNDHSNADGSHVCILIGSGIIAESYSMTAIRNILVMSRPDNISTLRQIIGRGVRTHSHQRLPIEQQHVDVYLMVSSYPAAKGTGSGSEPPLLTVEEKKYGEKVADYKVIQLIERLMHEVAVDAELQGRVRWPNELGEKQRRSDYELGILPYQVKYQNIPIRDISLTSFFAYFAQQEIDYVTFIIKKLFLEYRRVWEWAELFEAVQSPPFSIQIRGNLISSTIFNVALTALLYFSDNVQTQHVEILAASGAASSSSRSGPSLAQMLHDPFMKFMTINGVTYAITQVDKFYVMLPLDAQNQLIMDVESVQRPIVVTQACDYNLKEYLAVSNSNIYDEQKKQLIEQWRYVNIENMLDIGREYTNVFFARFIEEVIEYFFGVLTMTTKKKSEFHQFYLKLLYYFDVHNNIIWADILTQDQLAELYGDLFTKPQFKKPLAPTGYLNALQKEVFKLSDDWISTGMKNDFDLKLKQSDQLFDGVFRRESVSIPLDMIPLGHLISGKPRLYQPMLADKWGFVPSILPTQAKYKENDIIIGYDERDSTGIDIKFKLRKPRHHFEHVKDSRVIEKGMVCSTKPKDALDKIFKQLGVTNLKGNVKYQCQALRKHLIYREIKERTRGSNIKWFYFNYELK